MAQTLIILGGAIIGVVLFLETTSYQLNPNMPLSIDWTSVARSVATKVLDVVRDFIFPS